MSTFPIRAAAGNLRDKRKLVGVGIFGRSETVKLVIPLILGECRYRATNIVMEPELSPHSWNARVYLCECRDQRPLYQFLHEINILLGMRFYRRTRDRYFLNSVRIAESQPSPENLQE
jgi:hypothetical protein